MDMSRVLTTVMTFALLFSLVGCNKSAKLDVYIDSLNNEKRLLEDEVYRLEYENNCLQSELKNVKSKGGGSSSTSNYSNNDNENSEGDLPEPSFDEPSIDIPMIEEGESIDPSELELDFSQFQHLPGSQVVQASAQMPIAAHGAPQDGRVTHIWLNSRMTGGHNFDTSIGDEGLAVLIEPRNASDQFLPQAGVVRVRLFDPELGEDNALIDEWELVADEIVHRIRTLPLSGRGIYLLLPWTSQAPKHSNLIVQVGYETEDGRLLESSREIRIRMEGDTDISNQWTPRVDDVLQMAPKTMQQLTAELAQPAPVRKPPVDERGNNESAQSTTNPKPSKRPRPIMPPPRELFESASKEQPVSNDPPNWQPTRN